MGMKKDETIKRAQEMEQSSHSHRLDPGEADYRPQAWEIGLGAAVTKRAEVHRFGLPAANRSYSRLEKESIVGSATIGCMYLRREAVARPSVIWHGCHQSRRP
jgi:hypothetical protein